MASSIFKVTMPSKIHGPISAGRCNASVMSAKFSRGLRRGWIKNDVGGEQWLEERPKKGQGGARRRAQRINADEAKPRP